MSHTTSSTGQQGNLFDCDLPCFAIDGYSNSMFGGCPACDDLVSYSMHNPAWDGAFRPWVETVVGERNYWNGCTYYGHRNGAAYHPNIISGKALAAVRMNVSPTGTIITISCSDSGVRHTMWQGTSNSPVPDSLPIIKNAGCGGPQEITLTKASAFDCICSPKVLSPCPQYIIEGGHVTVNDCADCQEGGTKGWIFSVTGFANVCEDDGETMRYACGDNLNGAFALLDVASSGCVWKTGSRPETFIQCMVLDGTSAMVGGSNLQGVWHFSDGALTAMEGIFGLSQDDELCPNRSATFENPAGFPVYGKCHCAGQQGIATYYYDYLCPYWNDIEYNCPECPNNPPEIGPDRDEFDGACYPFLTARDNNCPEES